jgi:hypothetical protein
MRLTAVVDDERAIARLWHRWAVADLALPSPHPSAKRALWPLVILTGATTAFVYASFAAAAYLPAEELTLGASVAVDAVVLATAALVALYGCRHQLLSAPDTLLVPVAGQAVLAAGVAVAFDRLELPPVLAERWLLALLALQLVSMPIVTRLWGLLVMTLVRQPASRRADERGWDEARPARASVAALGHIATLLGFHLALVALARLVAPLISLHMSDVA